MANIDYLKELIEKIKEAQSILLAEHEVRKIEVKDSHGNSATVVSPFIHVNS